MCGERRSNIISNQHISRYQPRAARSRRSNPRAQFTSLPTCCSLRGPGSSLSETRDSLTPPWASVFSSEKWGWRPRRQSAPSSRELVPRALSGGAAWTACPLQGLGVRLHAARPPTFLPAVGHDAARRSDLAAIASRRDLSAAGRAARRPARTRPPGLPAARLPRRFQLGALSR